MKNIFGVRWGEKCYTVGEGKDAICDGCPVEMVCKDKKVGKRTTFKVYWPMIESKEKW
ncbi:MAG: hypothetical protein U0586_04775 [Candidatus Brocadiaceae bacterium]